MKTTLNAIRNHNPCEDSWKKLLLSLNKTEADDDAFPLRHILDTLGVEDAIWALRSIEGVDRDIRLFACDCAERVLPIYEAQYPQDTRPRNAIEVSRRYANGEATEQEFDAAWSAAYAAAGAAWAAARAAARAAEGAAARAAWAAVDAWAAAWYAARSAGGDAELKAQEELFIKYFC